MTPASNQTENHVGTSPLGYHICHHGRCGWFSADEVIIATIDKIKEGHSNQCSRNYPVRVSVRLLYSSLMTLGRRAIVEQAVRAAIGNRVGDWVVSLVDPCRFSKPMDPCVRTFSKPFPL